MKRRCGSCVYQLEIKWFHANALYLRIRLLRVIVFSELLRVGVREPASLRQTDWERRGDTLRPAKSDHWLTNSNQMQIPNLWISSPPPSPPPFTPPPTPSEQGVSVNVRVGKKKKKKKEQDMWLINLSFFIPTIFWHMTVRIKGCTACFAFLFSSVSK